MQIFFNYKMFIRVLTSIIFMIFLCTNFSSQLESKSEMAEKLYKELLKRQRIEQLAAIKSFQKIKNYEKQYQMINLMAEKVFTVIQDSRAIIESSPFIPGVSEFPLEDKIRDALSNIIENTALFSEIILRFPDISTAVLKTNNNWDILLQWGIGYCYQVRYLLDDNTIKVFALVSQELNHVPRDSNYINPYRKKQKMKEEKEEEMKKAKKKKKKLKKGPKLSFHDEF
ncbi:coiled-coil domain-containing protein 134-like [Sitophilus oryzae]|uniref:Coiled-coil domain-containing protein 134-like n=1 Tax=Sitophilus oryzae TaxID=7048 RepID=A0A6J2XIH8_SITOR|nr:coiled-coil domain-containing protein 134-like [Sitophilus oryzae]XP_030750719.1 coiled-coil domain-containing protein 134-like [Sitophilus oryzae]XP_030750720.1 coiled-coil domain-containing protein 134-like [Sitophilus oryzae]